MSPRNTAKSTPVAVLHLWEYDNAPANLRRLIPAAYAGGWLAFIRPGTSAHLLESLVARASSTGFPVMRCQIEDGGIVLAGAHPSILGP